MAIDDEREVKPRRTAGGKREVYGRDEKYGGVDAETIDLDPDLSELIAQACKDTPVTRRQWILRAILEKLTRDRAKHGPRMGWPIH